MNSLHSLTKVLGTAAILALASPLGLAAAETRNAPIPDPAATEVSQALDRLTSANDKRVSDSIDGSIATLAAVANDTVVAVAPPLARNVGTRFARDLRRLHRVRG